MCRLLSLLALLGAGLFASPAAAMVDASFPWVPGELIVKFRPDVSAGQKAALVRGRRLAEFRLIGAEHWQLGGGDSVERLVVALAADPRVEYVEPNYLHHTLEVPDDPLFGQLWGLRNTGQVAGDAIGVPGADIEAVEAWDLCTGSSSVIVAVIDTGIDYRHPDLAANIWTNPGEIAGNGIDDDSNGFIDDIHGWDFANGDSDPMDDNSHGTHVSGTIGAVANNGVGVAGVSWGVRLMALKAQRDSNFGSTADAISCIEYATTMGADVMCNSWGGGAWSEALKAAIQAAYEADIFFVASAGNDGTDNDHIPHYPSGYDVGNVIAVMATNNRDQRASESTWSSNVGPASVDVAAPGVRIWSTIRDDAYMYLSGTSMAAPHVAGALALLRSRFPGISVDDGLTKLMTVGNDPLPSLSGLCVTGARLNLRKLIADPDTIAPAPVTDLAVVSAASNWVDLGWTAPADDDKTTSYDLRYATAPISDQASWEAAMWVAGESLPAVAGSPQTMRVSALAAATSYHFSLRTRDDYGNLSGLSNSPGGTTLAPPTIAVAPASLAITLPPGGIGTRTLTITNAGAGVLDFTIPRSTPAGAAAHAPGATNSLGGPDGFGYGWTDSDAPGGPAFHWIDISVTGTAIALDGEANRGPFEAGFAFPFYGRDFTTFFVGANGCVSFTSTSTPAANTILPSPGAPGNLLALLWDQLGPGNGECFYYSDGTRLIVQYTNWQSVDAGGGCTMQMHLYPDGIIEYHYLTMTAPASGSATIGIQNGDATDGLTVAFNAAFTHDRLAIRFALLPPWLSVDTESGSLAAGASLDVDVTFSDIGLCGSHFEARVHVQSNDPQAPDVVIPASFNLTSTPEIAVSTTSLDLGSVRITESVTRNLNVTNRGCGDLTILGLGFDQAGFASPQALPLAVPAGSTVSVPVVFAPLEVGLISGRLTLDSNDPDSPTLVVQVRGMGLDIPDIAVAPALLAAFVPPGGAAAQQLMITNNGRSDLIFTIPDPEYVPVEGREAPPNPRRSPVEAAGSVAGSHQPQADAMAAGGPDAFGYRWTDSDQFHGPAYDWIEIAAIGTPIPFTLDDQNLGPYDIGFDFPFYGDRFSSFRACTNGWISFTGTSSLYANGVLPSAGAPANLIAPFWDNLTFATRGDAYYHNDGHRLIIEYAAVPRLEDGGSIWFQIHLYPSGRIEFHYRTTLITRDGATIGLQNVTRDVGLLVARDTNFVHDHLAIRIDATAPWLSVTPASGTVAAGEITLVTVAFDATGLCGSTRRANLYVLSNDPDSAEMVVPAVLDVSSAAAARVAPADLAFGNVGLSQNRVLVASVMNVGCRPLEVIGLSPDNPLFTVGTATPFSVAAGAIQAIDVTFTPVAVGPATGILTFATSDASHPTMTMTLAGDGVYPAHIAVTPDSIVQVVPPDRRRTATIHLENSGVGPLVYTVPSLDLLDEPATSAPAISPWGTVTPTAGTIPAGGIADLTVTFVAVDLAWGLYHGRVNILSNDLANPAVPVYLTMNVKDAVTGAERDLPGTLDLAQSVPNPFNPCTLIRIALPARGAVDLRIYDVRGSLVRTLAAVELAAGYHHFIWEGRTDGGAQAPSGVYHYRLRTAEGDMTRSMTLVK